jgi:surface carbohydrate biosynthesis protein (TIGR04326 family)
VLNTKTGELWLGSERRSVAEDRCVYLWNQIEASENFLSVLDYIESHDVILRSKYLAFIHDIGQFCINDKTICEHLSDTNGYSLWWMSKLSEKSHINSPQITDCIKLFALEAMLVAHETRSLVVYVESSNRCLLESIRVLCQNLNIDVLFHVSKSNQRIPIVKFLKKICPEIVAASLWLFKYLKLHWKLRKPPGLITFSSEESVMFFSYFFNLDVDKCSKGNFHSNQWGTLPAYVNRKGIKINWLHHFMRFRGMGDVQTAKSWIKAFNANPNGNGEHAFFESYLSIGLIFNVCKSYVKCSVKSGMLTEIRAAFKPINSANDFWPILKPEWIASVRGGAAIRNCMFIELVEKALKDTPMQNLGLYLQENQFWERALLHSWRRHGHGSIIGVPHASVNFWDLRYADDTRTVLDKGEFSQPQPDLVAVHGPAARTCFIGGGYPLSKIVKVEALRYLHINSKKHKIAKQSSDIERTRTDVIILGEIKLDTTIEMLNLIASAGLSQLNYTFKPHPACPLKIEDINFPNLLITHEPLNDIQQDFDLAIVAGSTSAAIDFYYSSAKVVVYLGKKELNLNPLRDLRNVVFVRTVSDFNNEMSGLLQKKYENNDGNEIFWTDPDLPRWSNLLKIWKI